MWHSAGSEKCRTQTETHKSLQGPRLQLTSQGCGKWHQVREQPEDRKLNLEEESLRGKKIVPVALGVSQNRMNAYKAAKMAAI